MSNETRDYPEWLDEELFSSLKDADAPKETNSPAAEGPKDAGQQSAAAKEAPDQKKKKKADKPAEDEPKAKKKKTDKSDEEEPKAKKKKADKTAEGDPKAKKKKTAPQDAGKTKKKKSAPDAEKDADAPDRNSEAPPAKASAKKEDAAPKQKTPGRAAHGLLVGLIVVVALLLALCAGAMVCAKLVTESNTNFPNITLGEVPVGGLTEEETIRALEQAQWDEERGGTLTAQLPEGVSFELDFLTAGAYQPKEEAAATAIRYGHGEDMFENLVTYINAMVFPVELSRTEFTIDRAYVSGIVDKAVDEFEERTSGEKYSLDKEHSTLEFIKGAGELTLDREAIVDKACALLLAGEHEMEWTEISGELTMPDFAAVAAELKTEPVNAYYDAEADEIVPEVMGVELDTAEVEKLWKEADVLEKVSVPITIIEPEITAEKLSEVLFHDKLGDCLTYLWGSSPNRISNVRLACSRFDGMVLQPGETFSYNDVVGERTAEAGFKVAPVYSGTAHMDGLGGGICQVSSTLYNAALYANLQIDERVCHTMIVGYLPLGLDATVDWPDTNFVFTNNRDYPIRIKAGVDDAGRSVTIEIWGTDVDGSYVDMLHYEWPSYDETYRNEYGIDVQVGYGARSIRRTYYADGSYSDEDNVYSYYHIPEDEIKWPVIETYDEDEVEIEDTGEEG
ncbi:MAG: VanW family protein [Oscillospiraceae bacterium]|nr:VanW family protein [Oscillospiraceae bacterium]